MTISTLRLVFAIIFIGIWFFFMGADDNNDRRIDGAMYSAIAVIATLLLTL